VEVTTPLDWEDLVLDPLVMAQVEMITRWAKHANTLMEAWKLGRWFKPGYRCLFFGPPGTGKTLTALLIGKAIGVTVKRIDLARELGPQFDEAARQGWIVLVEIDLLFAGNDRAANQQVAYLLQRLEEYPGLAILTTNLRDWMDEAFRRRFETVIHFTMPDAAERLRLWQGCFGDFRLAADVDLAKIAEEYELSGGSIVNVLRHAALMAAESEFPGIRAADLQEGIRLELAKGDPA